MCDSSHIPHTGKEDGEILLSHSGYPGSDPSLGERRDAAAHTEFVLEEELEQREWDAEGQE